jgi:hypothetical protein
MIGSGVFRAGAAAALAACLVSGCSRPSGESTPAEMSSPAVASPAGSSTHAVSGKAPAAVNGVPSVVFLSPREPKEFPPPAGTPFMDQVTLTFTPPVLFVRTGHPAEFRNSDDVLHNVRVREEATKEGIFNVAIPTGGSYTYTFDREGFYDVGCDIHPGMSAQVIASSTPYARMADPDGSFYFENVEPGGYVLTIFTGSEKIERSIEVSGARTEVGS